MSPTPPSTGCKRGFSLLEVLVCMTIMALALALSLPDLASSRRQWATKAGAIEVVSALRAARAEAITKRIYCAVRLYDGTLKGTSPTLHAYNLFECEDTKGERPRRWISGPQALPPGTRFLSGGNQTFVFGPMGTIVSRGINHKTIRLGCPEGVWHDITVLTATGRVKMKPMEDP